MTKLHNMNIQEHIKMYGKPTGKNGYTWNNLALKYGFKSGEAARSYYKRFKKTEPIGIFYDSDGVERFGPNGWDMSRIDAITYNDNIKQKPDVATSVYAPVKVIGVNGKEATITYDHIESKDTVLVIPDLHIPAHHKDALEFCKSLRDKYKATKIIFIGDIVDNYCTSLHSKDPNFNMTASQEIEVTKMYLKEWHDAFPYATVITGNHDMSRIFKTAKEAMIPKQWIKDIKDVLDTPTWTYTPELVHQGIYYNHGEKAEASKVAIYKGMSTIQGHLHCLPSTYEIFTETGIKNIKDVRIGENVYGYKNGKVVLTPVTNKVQNKITDKMLKFNGTYLKQQVTSEHNFYTNKDQYLPLNEFLDKDVSEIVIKALPVELNTDSEFNNLPDELLQLIVAVCADGTFEKTQHSIRFHLKHEYKKQRLQEILNALGTEINWGKVSKTGSVKGNIVNKELREKLYSLIGKVKMLPQWLLELNKTKRQVVIDELHHWDGHVYKKKNISYQYGSTKQNEIALVQQLLLMNGILSRTSKGRTICYNYKESYKTSPRQINRVKRKIAHKWVDVDNFEIACLETESSNFFIKTDQGSVELTGNSKSYVQYVKKDVFAVQVGTLVDRDSMVFDYAKNTYLDWWNGACIIQDGIPTLIPMK